MKRKKLKDPTFGKIIENKWKPSIGSYFKSAFFLHAIMDILTIILLTKISTVYTTTRIFLDKSKGYYYNKMVVVFNTFFHSPVTEFLCLSLCLFESLD